MPLSEGTRLGPYEILALIGAGGMGEVYKARDTRLDRIVAVKVSRDEFSERFAREARNVAALNHPNICTLHDIGPNYLVMEFVEGEMLSGPVPIDTALNFARQIAEAIEAAHEKGIVHRDLKPANIKVTPEGAIKVLDFGLAKALDADVPSPPAQDSPTLSMAMTRAGMILGTAAYMSPEQAKGRPADRRADIWAFGVVLYEILVGKQAFTGETAAETLASVLKEPISLDRLPKETPLGLRNLLSRCLERDVRRRLQAIGEARIILENPEVGRSSTALPDSDRRQDRLSHWVWIASTVVLLLALIAGVIWHFRPTPPPAVTRFPVALGEGQQLNTASNRLLVAVSPDGTQMVYNADQRFYLRSMADLQARVITGTESGSQIGMPAFSPDGKSLAFYVNTDQTIKRIAVSGGAAVTVCQTSGAPFGISWSREGIVFARGKEILHVSENGGKPEVLVTAMEGERINQPQMLPGGKEVMFTVGRDNGTNSDWDKAQIVVQALKSDTRKVLVEGGSDGRYVPTGHLVYALGGVLFARPFDLGNLAVSGSPVPIVEGVSRGNTGVANFSISDTGSLVYVPGPATSGFAQDSLVLALVDRKGDVEPLKVPPATYGNPRVSRDGKHVAYGTDDGKEANVWIYDLSGANAPRKLTFGGANRYPIWTADGERVAFQSDREGDTAIWWQRADGNGVPERLTKPEKGTAHTPDSWSPDNQNFLFSLNKNNTAAVWVFSLKDKKATLFAEAPSSFAGRSVFSPDGHWVAYQVLESGETRVYVQPFPATGAKYQVPPDGNTHHPVWSPDGKELFYIPGNGRLDSVSFSALPSPAFGPPMPMPKGSGFATREPGAIRSFDILPNGKFIGVVRADQVQAGSGSGSAATPQIQVVLNWFEELKQRVPLH